jgi:hypothetical protein
VTGRRAAGHLSLTESQHRLLTLVAMCVATFMISLDVTIVNVALPSMQRDLHMTPLRAARGRLAAARAQPVHGGPLASGRTGCWCSPRPCRYRPPAASR